MTTSSTCLQRKEKREKTWQLRDPNPGCLAEESTRATELYEPQQQPVPPNSQFILHCGTANCSLAPVRPCTQLTMCGFNLGLIIYKLSQLSSILYTNPIDLITSLYY